MSRKDDKYREFRALGGSRSGVFDISNKDTRRFVKKYKEFIPKSEIYKRDRNGRLVAVSLKQRRKDRAWLKLHS